MSHDDANLRSRRGSHDDRCWYPRAVVGYSSTVERRANRKTQELSKRFEVPHTRLIQGLIRTALDVLRVAPRGIAPIELTSERYRPELALAVFRRFDPNGVDDAKREILEAMELASIMG
jgi:hypothetical protein